MKVSLTVMKISTGRSFVTNKVHISGIFWCFFLMCAVTMFHQEVELKYHQLCQGDQEAAISEDNNCQGGFQFAVSRANRSSELKGSTCFSDGIQRWRASCWQISLGTHTRHAGITQSSTPDVAGQACVIITGRILPQTHWKRDGTEHQRLFMDNETLEIRKYGCTEGGWRLFCFHQLFCEISLMPFRPAHS